jgi:asparagine synthase (glutamine-hydrolysing)
MRNQLLRDADWAGMAHSLEIRTPLVDFELLRSLIDVVPNLKPGIGKRALGNAPRKPLPASVIERTKTGFGVPTGSWAAAASSSTEDNKGLVSRAWASEVFTHATQCAKAPMTGTYVSVDVAEA